MSALRRNHAKPDSPAFRVVAIGASAGGLEAFRQLLRPLPRNTGMAFVLIQHLDPRHKSMLTEIISRETEMPVREVRDRMILEPDHVYVIPPNKQMGLRQGALRLMPRAKTRAATMPIDYFFRSLAADMGQRAVAIILSGAESDGTQALEEIKAEGGITFAQDVQSAKVDSMPKHAAATGLVDFVLPPPRIAQELARIACVPIRDLSLVSSSAQSEEDCLGKIYALIKRHTGIDFTHYKQTTLKRRIQRRLLILNIASLEAYANFLKAHPAETKLLYGDLLIHVTSFFRDSDVFDGLKKKVFPRLMKQRAADDALRLWIPGCSTGEEVYSVAISLLEFLASRRLQTSFQIFATDISESVLQKARLGIYSEQAVASVSPERRKLFFSPVLGGFQVNKTIRQRCIFSKQNVASDPPFSRMDLICCRNVLIYLGSALQKKVMSIFHYALKAQGVLLLGKSETIGAFAELFNPLDRKLKAYDKATTVFRHHPVFQTELYPSVRANPIDPVTANAGDATNVLKEADQYVLGKHAPAGVIVDGRMTIVQLRGDDIGRYLELSPGTATFHLFKMAKEGLLPELRVGVDKAKKTNAPARRDGARVRHAGHFKAVTIDVIPLRRASPGDPYFLILFEESRLPASSAHALKFRASRAGGRNAAAEAAEAEVTRLKNELAATKSYLQSIIDDHEQVNEELKSANEEALSSNEEFQSTNEELETAKEELQATHEETLTLNEDLNNRNAELLRVNSDLLNLMNSANIPIVILTKDHRIRRLTPAAVETLGLSADDLGRSVHDLKLIFSVPDLKELIDSVARTMTPRQRDVQDAKGHWRLMNIQVYKTLDDVIDGVILSFTDIDAAKKLQTKAAEWTAELEERVLERTEALAKSQKALLQSEKLDAVGRLAGGVAHDFNNWMTGILGMGELVLDGLGPDHPHGVDLTEIINAAKKGLAVTKQLLAFGRRQVMEPRILKMNVIVEGMRGLLQRLLGEDVTLTMVLDPQIADVNMDQSSLEQVILNLCFNARDAMANGGTVTLQTAGKTVTAATEMQGLKISPGPYVTLTVADEGSGMTAETMARIFEPFFTTKGEGEGTGLGLATIYGIIEQCGGGISVQSVPDAGSTFTIYLPAVQGHYNVERRSAERSRGIRGGSETILVTEDETIVRKVMVRCLRGKGYTVLAASNAKEAVALSDAHEGAIQLLLTDIVMPGVNGRALAATLIQKRPNLVVLYMSGYDRDIIARRGVLEPGMAFIEKSFTAERLCHKVREVLDATGRA